MKVRSCVLVACMLVVPALALFSHLTPPTARQFLRCSVCDPLCQAVSAIEASLPFGSGAVAPVTSTKPDPSASEPSPSAVTVEEPALAAARALTAAPTDDGETLIESLPTVTLSQTAISTQGTADHDLPRSQAEWATLANLRAQLASLGASGIDCRPHPGSMPGYASSCRIGIDSDGQLVRMFHGQGPDAPAAMRSLIEQIRAWQDQQAGVSRQRF